MIEENLSEILNNIDGGNNLGEKITLVGATKTVSAENINRAISAGLGVVAENKVQEFREKTELIKGARQHFIGHLQSNKVKYIVGKVELIQSADNLGLIAEIDARAKKVGVVQDILLEVNIGKEPTKSGFYPEDAVSAARECLKLSNVRVKGVMAMLPLSDDKEYLAALTKSARGIYEQIKAFCPAEYLSVGMTDDYKTAIANGSNMIRIGSGIFGKRNYEEKI